MLHISMPLQHLVAVNRKMPMNLSTPLSKTTTQFTHKLALFLRIHLKTNSFPFSSSSITTNLKPLNELHRFYGTVNRNLSGFPLDITRKSCVFVAKAQNEGGISDYGEEKAGDDETEARGQSSIPERVRHLTKEAPEKPVRWPWLIVLGSMLYAWRACCGNFQAGKRPFKPSFDSLEATTVPDSVNSQQYLLSLAGLIGFAAVRNYISEHFLWTLLVCMFGFALAPAAVGEHWVRVITMVSYLTLAVFHYSKNGIDLQEGEDPGAINNVPVPLCAALAIGVGIAARWAGYRHLTRMIV